MTSFSLSQVRLRPGEEHREALEVELPAFEFGGQRYIPVPELVPALLVVTRAMSGTVLGLEFTARLHGPCYRCLGDAVLEVPIQAREYQAESAEDEELRRRTSSTATSSSRTGLATQLRSRCPRRSSAAPTAPASARSAART